MKTTADGRNWPLTIRITRRERWLLMRAARSKNTSKAAIVRRGLNPIFEQILSEVGVESSG